MLAPNVLFQGGNFSTWELTEATEKLCHHTFKALMILSIVRHSFHFFNSGTGVIREGTQ